MLVYCHVYTVVFYGKCVVLSKHFKGKLVRSCYITIGSKASSFLPSPVLTWQEKSFCMKMDEQYQVNVLPLRDFYSLKIKTIIT